MTDPTPVAGEPQTKAGRQMLAHVSEDGALRDLWEATNASMSEPRTDWRIEQEADGDWSLYYRGDGVTTPVHGFAATIPAEDDARYILARLREAATPPLDVERLARAIEIEDDRLPFLDAGIDSTAGTRAVAEQIADRYARLPSNGGQG